MGATSLTDFETVVSAAATAIASADYATARAKVVEARVLYMSIPEEMRGQDHQVKYRDLGSMLSEIDGLEASASRKGDTRRWSRVRTGFQS